MTPAQLDLTAAPAGVAAPTAPAAPPNRTRSAPRKAAAAPLTAAVAVPSAAPSTAVAVREPDQSGSVALMRMIEKAATDPAFDVAKLKELLEVKVRWEQEEARKTFVHALAAFKADPPTVIKNKKASFDHKTGGGKTEYEYATLDVVVAVIAAALSKHGLSHTWETAQGDGGMITVTCILRHELGHSEKVTLKAGPESSGTKNNIQAIGSTVTYLQRYTLLSATGLAAKGQDDDANFIDRGDGLSVEQKEELIDLMREVDADTAKFLKFLKVSALDELPAKRFNEAKQALEAKRGKSRP